MEQTTNLTLNDRILRPHTTDALDGHTVVVLEKTGTGGETFRYLLKPGQLPPKPEFSLTELFGADRTGPAYMAFAVTDHPELRTAVTATVTTDDQKHTFVATINVAYQVADPRLVVARRDDDPLLHLQKEISAVVARELAQADWDDIRHRFRDVERDVIAGVLPLLRRFASSYGFSVEALSLTCQLGEQDMKLIEQEREAELITEKKKIEYQQQVDLRVLDARVKAQTRQDMVFDAAADAVAGTIRRSTTVAELAKSLEALGHFSDSPEEFTRRLLEAASPGDAHSGHGAGVVIGEMLLETERIAWRSVDQKRAAQSAILHLLADLIVDDTDEERITAGRQRVIRTCAVLPADDADTIQRFSDVEWLRGQL